MVPHLTQNKPYFISLLCIAALLLPACTKDFHYSEEEETLLERLDNTIRNGAQIESAKQIRINNIKLSLSENITDEERYAVYDNLYDEYYQYDIDSAIAYAREKLALAKSLAPAHAKDGIRDLRLCDAEFDIADRYVLSGMYHEALSMIKDIDIEEVPLDLWPRYFHINSSLYGDMSQASDDPVLQKEYSGKRDHFRELLYESIGDEDIAKTYVWSDIEIDKGHAPLLVDTLLRFAKSDRLSVHERAIASYIAADVCLKGGRKDEAVSLLAESANYDLSTPVKEYKSLYELAELLYERGDVRRAYRYITLSINDAIAANARVNVQTINTLLPIISNSYANLMRQKHTQLTVILVILSVLAIAMVFIIQYTLVSRHKLARANCKLKEYLSLLQESNNIKELYLGRYLDMCSDHIGGLERYRSTLKKAAKNGGFQEVMDNLKSTDFIDNELNEFYAQFDASFLDLFPNFVEQLNALLQDDKHLEDKSKVGILTTEVRVAALIRLGVTDSVQISHFLRRSVSTIYNYRVKMRNAAKSDRDDFEKQIMGIGRL